MSFYLMLSSEGSRAVNPNFHGGDFNLQLDSAIDLRSEPWEVALSEISYTGQAFPNMNPEEKLVTLSYSGTPWYENDYVVTHGEMTEPLTAGFFMVDKDYTVRNAILSKDERNKLTPATFRDKFEFDMPRKHYSWTLFKWTFNNMCKRKALYEEIVMSDTAITMKRNKYMSVDVFFSASMQTFLQINTFTLTITDNKD